MERAKAMILGQKFIKLIDFSSTGLQCQPWQLQYDSKSKQLTSTHNQFTICKDVHHFCS